MRVILDPVKLRAQMFKAKLSMGEVSRITGIQRPHISRWCTKSNEDQLDVKLSSVAKLATALGLKSIEPLLRYMPDKAPEPVGAGVETSETL